MSFELIFEWPEGARPECPPREFDTEALAQRAERIYRANFGAGWPKMTIQEKSDAASTNTQ